MLMTIAVWLLAALLIPLNRQDPAPVHRADSENTTEAKNEAVEVPPDLARWLDEVKALRDRGDLEGARIHLSDLLRAKPYEVLAQERIEVAWIALFRVREVAASLRAAREEWAVLEEMASRLEAARGPEHTNLINVKVSLALARKSLGDIRGALTLEEELYGILSERGADDRERFLIVMQNLAGTRLLAGDARGSLELSEELLRIREPLLDPDDAGILDVKSNIAAACIDLGKLDRGLALAEEVHEARSRLLEDGHPRLLIAKAVLGEAMLKSGQARRAVELFEATLEGRLRTLAAGHPDVVAAKADLGAALLDSGDTRRALGFLKEVGEARAKSLGVTHPLRLRADSNLALAYERLDVERAITIRERIVAALEEDPTTTPRDRLRAEVSLAKTLLKNREGDRARTILQRALDSVSGFAEAEDPVVLDCLECLGSAYLQGGRVEQARELFEVVLAERTKSLPKDYRLYLRARLNCALAEHRLGDSRRALEEVEFVHSELRELLRPTHHSLLHAREQLALIRLELGDFNGALALLAEVFSARYLQLPPDHPYRLEAQLNLAKAQALAGQLEQARVQLEENVRYRESLWGPQHVETARALDPLGVVLKRLGETQEAQSILENALDILVENLPPEHSEVLNLKRNVAVLKKVNGDLEGVLQLEEEVVETRRRTLPDDHGEFLDSTVNLASTYRHLGRDDTALRLLLDVVDKSCRRVEYLALRSPRFARSAGADELSRLSLVRSLARPIDQERAVDRSLFRCAASLRTLGVEVNLIDRVIDRDPEIREKRAKLASLRRELSELALRGDRAEDQRRLVELTEERDSLSRRIRGALLDQGVSLELPSVESVMRSLAEDEAAIFYVAYPSGIVDAFVLSQEFFGSLDLGTLEDISVAVVSWRSAAGVQREGEPARTGEPGDESGLERAERELVDLLLNPCLDALEAQPRRLRIVLDDVLHLVPLEALSWDGTHRVGDVFEISYDSSLGARAVGADSTKGTLVAVGGVEFGPQPTEAAHERHLSDAARPSRFLPLPRTQSEVMRIAELYEENSSHEALLLGGRDATRERVVGAIPRARYLHIATHGYFAGSALRSERDVQEESSREGGQPELELGIDVKGLAPLVLCGLAFAGANRDRADSSAPSNVLTAEELAGVDLTACELAVLSACETNVGIRRAGQGIQSLQTALHAAGARTAITSLWKVDDAATRKLFERFYTYLWVEGMGKAEALWKAKCDLRAERYPVRDWAAWVLTGDPD